MESCIGGYNNALPIYPIYFHNIEYRNKRHEIQMIIIIIQIFRLIAHIFVIYKMKLIRQIMNYDVNDMVGHIIVLTQRNVVVFTVHQQNNI